MVALAQIILILTIVSAAHTTSEDPSVIKVLSLTGDVIAACPKESVKFVADLRYFIPKRHGNFDIVRGEKKLSSSFPLDKIDSVYCIVSQEPEMLKFCNSMISTKYGVLIPKINAESFNEKLEMAINGQLLWDYIDPPGRRTALISLQLGSMRTSIVHTSLNSAGVEMFRISPLYTALHYRDTNGLFGPATSDFMDSMADFLNKVDDPDQGQLNLLAKLIVPSIEFNSTEEILCLITKSDSLNNTYMGAIHLVIALIRILNVLVYDKDIAHIGLDLEIIPVPPEGERPKLEHIQALSELVLSKYRQVELKLNRFIHLIIAPQLKAIYDLAKDKRITLDTIYLQPPELAQLVESFKTIFSDFRAKWSLQ